MYCARTAIFDFLEPLPECGTCTCSFFGSTLLVIFSKFSIDISLEISSDGPYFRKVEISLPPQKEQMALSAGTIFWQRGLRHIAIGAPVQKPARSWRRIFATYRSVLRELRAHRELSDLASLGGTLEFHVLPNPSSVSNSDIYCIGSCAAYPSTGRDSGRT